MADVLLSAIIGSVQDALVDGEIAKAPSQNAVFDALALKFDKTGGPISGDTELTGSSRRIRADWSSGAGTRAAFQTSTLNGITNAMFIPNGTGNIAIISAFAASDPTNSAVLQFRCETSSNIIGATRTGTGTLNPVRIQFDGVTTTEWATGGGMSVTGALSATGLITASNAQFTGGTAPAGGTGAEVLFTGGIGYLLSFNRTAGTYQPVEVLGSTAKITALTGDLTLVAGGATVGVFSGTGLAITGALSATGTVSGTVLKVNASGAAVPGSITSPDANWGMLFYPLISGAIGAYGWTNRAGSEIMRLTDAGALLVTGTVKTSSGTVASLPTAASAGAGARAFVTDANATTFASIVAGGGANGVPVYSDATNWRIG